MAEDAVEKGVPIRPVGDHLVVKVVDEGEYATEEGFVLPKNYHQKPMVGTVVELGDGYDSEALAVSVGDTVLMPKYGATEIRTEHGNYQLIHRKDIIGVV